MSSESPAAVSPPVYASSSDPLSEDSRWAAWKARGTQEDLLVRARLRVALPLLAVAAAVLFYFGMVR
jgi:hypothetical protein